MIKSAKEDILSEWKYSDNSGPNVGLTVLGIEKKTTESIATIGVARASENVWIAQTAAVIDDPKYLCYTHSIYSWRTRAILQQIDGEFHLAFFDADKPFLDRFFRKFHLTRNDSDKLHITWSEWFAHYLTRDFTMVLGQKNTSEAKENTEMIANILKKPPTTFTKYGFELHERKHLHIAQLLSSIWNTTNTFSEYLNGCIPYFEHGQKFILVMNKYKFDDNLENIPGAVKYTKKVVWTCHRNLLPKFLQHSLRSLAIMNMKYGNRHVA